MENEPKYKNLLMMQLHMQLKHFKRGASALLPITVIVAAFTIAISPARAADRFDHAVFDRLLAASVADGRIDYARIGRGGELGVYLRALATAKIDGLSVDDRLAFWLNAYNALVIRNVLDNPGLRRPTDVAGFFDKKTFTVAGRQLTLNGIENEIIRPQFHEPLIHFGLVCAARSCPPILGRAYDGRTVRATLAANARTYLASAQNRWDARTKTLHLSKIFEWYKSDFGGDAGLRKFARSYGPPAMRSLPDDARIVYLEYDWAVNSK